MIGENNYSVWGIPINSSYSKTLAHKSSNHFYIIVDWDMSEHETFYFSSPHLHNIDVENPEVAFYRAKALLQLMNGIRELENSPPITLSSSDISHFEDFNKGSRFTIKANPQLEYEELQSPFLDSEELNHANSRQSLNTYEVDLFELAYKEELVKEVFIFLSLIKTDPLYLLVNVSKIVENIKFDLGLDENKKENGKNMKSREKRYSQNKILNEVSEILKDDFAFFQSSYKFFTNTKGGGFRNFVNTRDGSGIFARHGATGEEYDSKLPTISFEEINYNIRVLVSEWINYKLLKTKGYRYPPFEKRRSLNL